MYDSLINLLVTFERAVSDATSDLSAAACGCFCKRQAFQFWMLTVLGFETVACVHLLHPVWNCSIVPPVLVSSSSIPRLLFSSSLSAWPVLPLLLPREVGGTRTRAEAKSEALIHQMIRMMRPTFWGTSDKNKPKDQQIIVSSKNTRILFC